MYHHLVNLVWVGIVLYTAIVFVNITHSSKKRSIAKDSSFAKIDVLFDTLQSPLSEQPALSLVLNFELLDQLNLVLV